MHNSLNPLANVLSSCTEKPGSIHCVYTRLRLLYTHDYIAQRNTMACNLSNICCFVSGTNTITRHLCLLDKLTEALTKLQRLQVCRSCGRYRYKPLQCCRCTFYAPYFAALPSLYANSGRMCSASMQHPPPCFTMSVKDKLCTLSHLQCHV